MSANLSSSLHLHPIMMMIIIILLIVLPRNDAQDYRKYYHECNKSFDCGHGVRGIRYPFWGGDRPSYCGLRGLKLSCKNGDFPVLDTGNMTFRVVYINQSSHAMTMKRDALRGGFCPSKLSSNLSSTELDIALFDYGHNTEDIGLYYDCSPHTNIPVTNSVRNNFTCMIGDKSESIGFFGNASFFKSQFQRLQLCNIWVGVPVNRTVLEEFRNNVTMQVHELWNPSFLVYYRMHEMCLVCKKSGGLCWSGKDSKRISGTNLPKTPCLCRDGAYPYVCPKPGRKKQPRLKMEIGTGAVLIGILLLCFVYNCRKFLSSTLLSFLRTKTKNDRDVEAFIMRYGSSTPMRYKFNDLRKITDSFKHELGKGGYGNVYKGTLPDGRVVAVKVLKASKGRGDEFINEVACIGRTSHVNVVSLLGFCYEGEKQALVYEFMPNGSLEKFIYSKTSSIEKQQLGWKKLYNIALGIARGLEYLHRGCKTRILHFDIKPHNILLDEDFCPKISDFGLAKLYTRKESIVYTMEARGTVGYIAPELISRNFGGVSHKSDVYSYGMMVLEMVGGRKNVDIGVVRSSEIYFPQWIYKHIKLDEELSLASEMTAEEDEIAKKMILVGLWCIQTDPLQRPSISKVIDMLEGSKTALEIPPKPYLCSPLNSASNSCSKPFQVFPSMSDLSSFITSVQY